MAPAAPGKAITESVWPAKVWRRSTMNQPIAPAITATIAPASSACTMKGNSVSCSRSPTGSQERLASSVDMIVAGVVVGGRLRRADDDEAAVGGLEHLDRRAVEAAQGGAGDDLSRGSLDTAPPAK